MNKRKKFKFIFLSILFYLMSSKSVSADQIVPNNLYVAYPQGAPSQYLDISQSLGNDKNYLITYSGHGLGNQLMGYQYRPEKQGYIIYSAQNQDQLVGQSTDPGRSEYVKSIKFSEQVNSLTEIPDEFIWDIKLVDASQDSYTISNRKSSLYLTTIKTSNDTLVKLSPYANSSQQFFKLRTKNGVYVIRSYGATHMVWDISDGASENHNIISYNFHGGDNQKWLITYNPSANAYMIVNSSKRNLIFNQAFNYAATGWTPTGSPTAINNSRSFEQGILNGSGFKFLSLGVTSDNKEIVNIQSSLGNYTVKKDDVNSGVSKLSLTPNDSTNSGKWILDLISALPEPNVSNLIVKGSVSGESDTLFVGEKLTVTGDVSAVGFSKFDVYYRLNMNASTLVSQDSVLDDASNGKFQYQIDTSTYSEGIAPIEFFVRADKAFLSNKIPKRLNLKYPTPTGDAVPQSIDKNTPLSSLDLSKFVVNLHDELGNPVTIDSISKLDTSVSGIQQSEVKLRNKYKTSVIKVPVNVIDKTVPTGTGKITVVNQNDASPILKSSDLSTFVDDLVDKSKIITTIKSGQDIDKMVSTVGPTYFDLVLTNKENGLSNEVRVPVYVKEEQAKTTVDKKNLLVGKDFTFNIKDTYPSNDSELSGFVKDKSQVQLWEKTNFGELVKLDESKSVLDATHLPKPGIPITGGKYPFAYSYDTLTLNLNMSIIKSVTVTIEYLDEAGNNIHEPRELSFVIEGEDEKYFDASMDSEIADALTNLDGQSYQLVSRPENENRVLLDSDSTLIYRFTGILSLRSYPQKISFGQQHLLLPFISDDKFSYDSPLIVWDNRKTENNQSKSWELTATLIRPLTSEINPTSILYDALYYQTSDKNIKLPLVKDQAQIIKKNKSILNQPEFNLSQEWDDKKEGLALQLFSKEVDQEGDYSATILWKIGDLP